MRSLAFLTTLTCRTELTRIGDAGNHRGGGEWADAGDGHEALAVRFGALPTERYHHPERSRASLIRFYRQPPPSVRPLASPTTCD